MLKLFPVGVALVILSVGVAMAQPEAADEGDGPIRIEAPIAAADYRNHPGPDAAGNVIWASGPFELGQYWLGVECLPVMPALRAQLNLPEKQGLLVAAVAPESPAASAGIKQHDILLASERSRLPRSATCSRRSRPPRAAS